MAETSNPGLVNECSGSPPIVIEGVAIDNNPGCMGIVWLSGLMLDRSGKRTEDSGGVFRLAIDIPAEYHNEVVNIYGEH